jgi:hypothetical protein
MTGSAQTNITAEADGHHYIIPENFKNPLSQFATDEAPKGVSREEDRKRQASRKEHWMQNKKRRKLV